MRAYEAGDKDIFDTIHVQSRRNGLAGEQIYDNKHKRCIFLEENNLR